MGTSMISTTDFSFGKNAVLGNANKKQGPAKESPERLMLAGLYHGFSSMPLLI